MSASPRNGIRELMLLIELTLLRALRKTGFGSFGLEYEIYRVGKYRVTVRGTESRMFYLTASDVEERLKELETG